VWGNGHNGNGNQGPPGNGGAPGGGNMPGWPAGYDSQAQIDPATYNTYLQQGIPWYRQQVSEPLVFIPADDRIATQPRMRSVTITNEAAGTEVLRFVQVDIPSTVYALSGAAATTDGSALPVGRVGRETFRVRFQHNVGDRLTPVTQLGDSIVGSAQFPAKIGGAGWVFDRGGTVEIGITPLIANLTVDITLWIIEIRGPSNYNPLT
jgi:hypothetical protein